MIQASHWSDHYSLNNKWLIALYGGFTLLAYAMSLGV